ncbi:hypothetical protein IFM89_016477 [Coptis chinensis]|uniref:Phospholipase A1 n=1 Tax=Coptis chinensis TaxID=261450 RepID=A0A835I5D2_9MAGN|nr:hypothetical protein IFM89_016477 [Coptis chinensis]
MSASLSRNWRQLSGQGHWRGLLNPLTNDMRTYLLHYGDLVEATYDTFIKEKVSQYAGGSMWPPTDLLSKVGLQTKNNPLMKYKVTKYLYATSSIPVPEAFMMRSLSRESWSKESNWIGYIAVATDEGRKLLGRRDIVVAWRGTITTLEWIDDFNAGMVSAAKEYRSNLNPMVHAGFWSVYTSTDAKSAYNKTSARDQVFTEVRRLVRQYKNEHNNMSVTVCGHSLGAALSVLNSADIVANGVAGPNVPVTAFPYACPKPGNRNFKKFAEGLKNLRVLRTTNRFDPVPMSPAIGFADVGEQFLIDSTASPYLKNPLGFSTTHAMESYLHAIAGARGSAQAGFMSGAGNIRDISLVNKYIDGLKNKYLIPPRWWSTANKGMVQQPNGQWKMFQRRWKDEDFLTDESISMDGENISNDDENVSMDDKIVTKDESIWMDDENVSNKENTSMDAENI